MTRDWDDTDMVDVGSMGDVDRGEGSVEAERPDPHEIDWMEDGDDAGACPVCGGHVVHETVSAYDWCGETERIYISTYCEGARDDGAGCGWIA